MIVLRSPKGWTAPRELDGHQLEGSWRAHQVPDHRRAGRTPPTSRCSSSWMRSYQPEELFDAAGAPVAAVRATRRPRAPAAWARTRTPTAGCSSGRCACPDFAELRGEGRGARAGVQHENTRPLGRFLTEVMRREPGQLPGAVARREHLQQASTPSTRSPARSWMADDPARGPGRHALAPRRPGDGDALRAHAGGDAGGLLSHRPPRLLLHLRGLRPHHRLHVQPARQVAGDLQRASPGGRSWPRSTCSSPRRCGARTTTASPTRTRASSTWW